MGSRLEIFVAIGFGTWISLSCGGCSERLLSDEADEASMSSSSEVTSGAGDDGDDGDDAAPVDTDYETNIQPIWDANCITGCHEPGGIPGAGTVLLTPGASYTTLTTQKPVYAIDATIVVAGSVFDSYLIDALRRPPGTIVRQMPLVLDDSRVPTVGVQGTPLPEETIVLIEAWIDAGAKP